MMLVDLRDRRGRGGSQVILPYLVIISASINKTNKQNQSKNQTKNKSKDCLCIWGSKVKEIKIPRTQISEK